MNSPKANAKEYIRLQVAITYTRAQVEGRMLLARAIGSNFSQQVDPSSDGNHQYNRMQETRKAKLN